MNTARLLTRLSAFCIACAAQWPAHAVSDIGSTSTPLNYSTYFGINGVGMLHRPNDKVEIDRRFALVKELGVKSDRSDFWWSEFERRPGAWNYDIGDRAMKTYRDNG